MIKLTRARSPGPWEPISVLCPPIKDHQILVTLGYDYQESYKKQSDSVRCPVDTEAAVVPCVSGSFGQPNRRRKHLGYLDVRGLIVGFGFSLKYTHDFENNVNGLDLPIYVPNIVYVASDGSNIRVAAVNGDTGEHLATYEMESDERPLDKEDLALGPCNPGEAMFVDHATSDLYFLTKFMGHSPVSDSDHRRCHPRRPIPFFGVDVDLLVGRAQLDERLPPCLPTQSRCDVELDCRKPKHVSAVDSAATLC